MKVLRVISRSTFLFMLCIIENYLNTFISLDFGVYVFLISLLYIGTELFNQNLVIPIFLSGILYDSFFSTYYLGLYTSIFLVVVVVSNFAVSRYSPSNFLYIVTVSLCLLIYKLPIILEFDLNYWLTGYLTSVFVNSLIFLFLKRALRNNV
ncbi:MAG: hypothetical protein ISQ16_02640 [Candidatus Actinomarina sp.]|jgi:hypothetical protein|nr:hypothetical protein [Candidatus Actinomarina sp.]MBL6762799.1 hypothetical protein [Candidatus Actinomarina sp.]MBL6835941.1 hypothetical protein [Candidatus Actinomarina sp.]MDA3037506.1 hypothetical protein [Actinomycetota bacterium]